MREIRYLDSFVAGEKPVIDVQFYETEQDLTGFSLDWRVERDGTEVTPAGSIAWKDQSLGQARVTFGEGDIDVTDGSEWSRYKMELWTGDGTTRIATLLIVFDVYQHVGSASPSI